MTLCILSAVHVHVIICSQHVAVYAQEGGKEEEEC
jgi:hypothetical protein